MSTPPDRDVTPTYSEFVEFGRRRKPRRPVREFRYRVEVRQIEPSTPGGDSYAAKAIEVVRLHVAGMPIGVQHSFREWNGKTRDHAIDKARSEVKDWIALGASESD